MFQKGMNVYYIEVQEGASSFNFFMNYEDAQDVVNFIQNTPGISIKNHGEGIVQTEVTDASLRDMEKLDLPTDYCFKINFQGSHAVLVDGTCRYSSKLIQLAKGEIEEVVVEQSEEVVQQVIQQDPKQSAKDALKAKMAQTQAKPAVQVGQQPVVTVGQSPVVTAGPAPQQRDDSLNAIRQQTQEQKATHVSPVVGRPVTVGAAVNLPTTRQIGTQQKTAAFTPSPTPQKSKMDKIYDLLLLQQQDNQQLVAEVQQLRAEVQALTQALYQ